MRFSIVLLACSLLLAACGGAAEAPQLPQGDADTGAQLFAQAINGAPSCNGCHVDDPEAQAAGPYLGNYAAIAAERVAGQSAYDYTYDSILRPAAHIVEGYSNLMYGQYRSHLSEQETADLIAYLLTLEEPEEG